MFVLFPFVLIDTHLSSWSIEKTHRENFRSDVIKSNRQIKERTEHHSIVFIKQKKIDNFNGERNNITLYARIFFFSSFSFLSPITPVRLMMAFYIHSCIRQDPDDDQFRSYEKSQRGRTCSLLKLNILNKREHRVSCYLILIDQMRSLLMLHTDKISYQQLK